MNDAGLFPLIGGAVALGILWLADRVARSRHGRGLAALALYRIGRSTRELSREAGRRINNRLRGQGPVPRARIPVALPGRPTPHEAGSLDYSGCARLGELRRLRRGGLPLGRHLSADGWIGPRLEWPLDQVNRHVMVVGPSGSGKTHGIMVPWLAAALDRGSSVVAIDVTGRLLSEISALAPHHAANAWYWDLGAPGRSLGWNFLSGWSDDTRDLEATVLALLGKRSEQATGDPYFHRRDTDFLRTALRAFQAGTGGDGTPAEFATMISSSDNYRSFLRTHATATDCPGATALAGASADEYLRDSAAARHACNLFLQGDAQRVMSRSDFDLAGLLGAPRLLVVGGGLDLGQAGEMMSSLLVARVLNLVYRQFRQAVPRPVTFILDEAPRLRQRIDLEEALSVGRGAGAGFVLACQDLDQFGDERACGPLLASCDTVVSVGRPSPRSAAQLSARFGQRLAEFVDPPPLNASPESRNHLRREHRQVPVLGSQEVMYPPAGRHPAVIQCKAVSPKPFLVDLAR